jgi:hypothetical protein
MAAGTLSPLSKLLGNWKRIGERCFFSYGSLASATFDANSRLCHLENDVFCMTGLQSITLPRNALPDPILWL